MGGGMMPGMMPGGMPGGMGMMQMPPGGMPPAAYGASPAGAYAAAADPNAQNAQGMAASPGSGYGQDQIASGLSLLNSMVGGMQPGGVQPQMAQMPMAQMPMAPTQQYGQVQPVAGQYDWASQQPQMMQPTPAEPAAVAPVEQAQPVAYAPSVDSYVPAPWAAPEETEVEKLPQVSKAKESW
mmetsp:Transcript_41038/g.97238  ORF Transcript_41038/g.97238 Transcript_41038/m.97238 type:complete len:182 (-) Transcript_41038:50-595(-)